LGKDQAAEAEEMTSQRNPPALRSEIEKALDEIISNEEGMRFQGLAVILAKQRWTDLIACERKKDYGLDAHAGATLAPDKIGKGLACSITADIKKIAADAKETNEHFPDVTTLIFATPQKVSNVKKEEWAEQIRKEFGYDLYVISREDVIASLMEPANASLCRSFFAIDVEIQSPLADLIDRVKDAASAEAATWTARTPRPLIDLLAAKVDKEGNDSSQVYSLAGLCDALGESRRLVLEAPAGRGKTTTLAQLANLYTGLKGTAFLIDLPLWVSSPHGILEYFSSDFHWTRTRTFVAHALATIWSTPLVFLVTTQHAEPRT
jgi:flagellar biosynthesis GTPase FlhF